MSEKIWSDDAWSDYLYWQAQDKKTLKRINQLIKDIERNGCINGIGKPEALSGISPTTIYNKNDLRNYSRRSPFRLCFDIILQSPCRSFSWNRSEL